MENSRKVPAWGKNGPHFTKTQWLVLFYLLSISKWNSKDNEKHYFIYADKVHYTEIARALKFSSYVPVKKAMMALLDNGIVEYSETGSFKPFYKIEIPFPYTIMNMSIVKAFYNFSSVVNIVTSLRAFSILYQMYKYDEREFSLTLITKLLDLDRKTTTIEELWIMLNIWKEMGIIEYEEINYTNRVGTSCVKYVIKDIQPLKEVKLEKYFNTDITENIEKNSVDLYNKLKGDFEKDFGIHRVNWEE